MIAANDNKDAGLNFLTRNGKMNYQSSSDISNPVSNYYYYYQQNQPIVATASPHPQYALDEAGADCEYREQQMLAGHRNHQYDANQIVGQNLSGFPAHTPQCPVHHRHYYSAPTSTVLDRHVNLLESNHHHRRRRPSVVTYMPTSSSAQHHQLVSTLTLPDDNDEDDEQPQLVITPFESLHIYEQQENYEQQPATTLDKVHWSSMESAASAAATNINNNDPMQQLSEADSWQQQHHRKLRRPNLDRLMPANNKSTETYNSVGTHNTATSSSTAITARTVNSLRRGGGGDQLSNLGASAGVGAISAETKWQQLERLLKRRFSIVTMENVAETRERCNQVLETETMSNKEACRFLDSVRHNIARSEQTSLDALHEHCAHPLEDVNPYMIPIRDTFCYMAPSWGNRMALFRFTATKSLQLFGPYNLLRKLALYLITHKLYEMFILLVILVNFVLLAGGPEWQTKLTSYLEPIFLGIFTFEATLRIVANGFSLAPYSYMRDVWNVLDLYIILVGVIGMIREYLIKTTDRHSSLEGVATVSSDDVNLTGIRVIRVFRAVKVLALFPALRTTVSALGKVIRRLVPAVLLCFLFMWIVALMGIELFGGKSNTPMSVGCYDLSSPYQRALLLQTTTELNGTQQQQRAGTEAVAFLCNMTFPVSTATATTATQHNNSSQFLNDNRNNEANQLNINAVTQQRRPNFSDEYEFVRVDNFNSNSENINVGEQSVNSDENFIKKRFAPQHAVRVSGYAALHVDCHHRDPYNDDDDDVRSIVCLDDSGAISMTNFNNFASGMLMALRLVTGDAWEESLSDHMAIVGSVTVLFFAPVITFGTLFLLNLILAIVEHEYNSEVVGEQEEAGLLPISAFATNFDSTFDYHRTIHHLAALDLSLVECESLLQRMEIVDEHRRILLPLLQENPVKVADKAIQQSRDKHNDARLRRSLSQTRRHPLHQRLYRFRCIVRAYTESILFEFIIVVAIVLNTIILCTEHYQQPLLLTKIQDAANLFFTILFTVECCIKFIAQGFKYFNAGWNILDLVVVIISLLDFFLSSVGSLTALRTLRILRIFKLARSWQSMRHLINQTISTLSGIASVAFLLVVVIFIFAIISTEMLSDHFNTGRWHFGDFGHSAILVTRIMLGNWLHPLQDCIASAPDSASARATCHVIIIFEMLSGSLLFLNLFLALLLSKFSADVFKHTSTSGKGENEGGGEISISEGLEKSGQHGATSGALYASVDKSDHDDDASSSSSSSSGSDDDDDGDENTDGQIAGVCLASTRLSITSAHSAVGRKTGVLQSIRAFALGKRVGKQWLTRTRSNRSSELQTGSVEAAAHEKPPLLPSNAAERKADEEEDEIDAIAALPTSRRLRPPLKLAEIVQLEKGRIAMHQHLPSNSTSDSTTLETSLDSSAGGIATAQHALFKPTGLSCRSSRTICLKSDANHSTNVNAVTSQVPRVVIAEAPSLDDDRTSCVSTAAVRPSSLATINTSTYVAEPGETQPVKMPADLLYESQHFNHKLSKSSENLELQTRQPSLFVNKVATCQKCRHSMIDLPNGGHHTSLAGSTSPGATFFQPLEVVKAQEADAIQDALQAAEKSCAAEIDAERCKSTKISLPQSKLRRLFFLAVNHWLYDCAVLLVILASSVCLVWEVTTDHSSKNDWQERAFMILNCCFTGFFTLEIIFNCLGRGIRSYFTSGWDLLDLVIVIVSYADLVVTLTAASTTDLSTFRILRVLRAFRPLRAVKRWSGMRIVVNALLFSLPGIRDVLLLWIVFWTVFSIVGVQLFAGRLFRCVGRNDAQVVPHEIAADKIQCLNLQNVTKSEFSWSNAMINFDNVLNGYVAILQIATLEGWEELSLAAIDSPDTIGDQPTSENRTVSGWIYIFCVILVNGMFVMQLLVGILVEKFQQLKRQYENAGVEYMMSETQKQMIKALKKIIRRRPASAMTSNNVLQRACTSVALSGRLDAVISVVIVVNMITSSLVHIVTNERVISVINLLEGVCTCAYVMEATVKIAGLHLYYFMDAWNCFDFAVTGISVIGFVTDLTHATSHGASFSLLRTFRLLRVARILRLVRLEIAQDVRTLLAAFVAGLPAVVNVLLLLFLIMFIFCIIGLSQFREARASSEPGLNFNNFANAMSWLFVLSTGAGWNDALAELSAMENGCPNVDVNCPVGIKAVLFVASYVFIVFLLLLNLLVGLVLEAYSNTHSMSSLMGEDDIDSFYHVFNHFDARRKQFIPVAALSDFLSLLEYPLKLRKPNALAIRQLQVPIRELIDEQGKCRVVHAVDLLETMVRARLGTDVPIPENIKQEIQRKFYEKWPQLLDAHVVSNTFFEPFVGAIRNRIVQSDLFAPVKFSAVTASFSVEDDDDDDDGETDIVNQLYQLLFAKGNVTVEKLRTLFLLLDARVDEQTDERIQRMMSEVGGRPISYVQLSIMCARHFETLSTDDVDLRNAFLFAAGIRSNTSYVGGALQPIVMYGRDFARLIAAVGFARLEKKTLRQLLARFKLKRKSTLLYEDFAKLMKNGLVHFNELSEIAHNSRQHKWNRATRELTLVNARNRDSRAQLYALLSNCGLLASALAATIALMFIQT